VVSHEGKEATRRNTKVKLENPPSLCATSFPPCEIYLPKRIFSGSGISRRTRRQHGGTRRSSSKILLPSVLPLFLRAKSISRREFSRGVVSHEGLGGNTEAHEGMVHTPPYLCASSFPPCEIYLPKRIFSGSGISRRTLRKHGGTRRSSSKILLPSVLPLFLRAKSISRREFSRGVVSHEGH
jgi:hypothetical protein